MGILQKIQRLSESGDLKITSIQENNEYWYKVTYIDKSEKMTIDSYMPTLQKSIESVYSQLQHYNMKEVFKRR